MKTKNLVSILLGAVLLIGSGVLFAFQSSEGETANKPRKVKITIIKDNNGSINKTEDIIEVKSREDVKAYLKSKNVDVSELNFYGNKGPRHHKPQFASMWVYNVSGKPMSAGPHMMFIKSDVNMTEDNDGERTEKVIVKTIVMEDSDNTEKQEVKIEKVIDENGNVVVHKWVNGEEVDPNSKTGNHRVFMEEANGEMIIEVKGENGESDKVVKIKKEIDKDGNVTIMKSVNGEDFKKVEEGHGMYKCSSRGGKSGNHSCEKGESKCGGPHHGHAHHGGHGPRGFAARSNDGSVMIFGVPVDENGNEIKSTDPTKKSIQEETKSDLKIEDVTFYPNPTESQFSISFNSAEKGKINIQVKDMQGKDVLNKEFDHEGGEFKQELELKDVEAGMYIFNVTQNGKTYTHKLLVR